MGNEHLSPIPAPYNKIRVVTCPLQQDEGGDKTDLIPLLYADVGDWTVDGVSLLTGQ